MRQTKPNIMSLILGLLLNISGYWLFGIWVLNILLFIYKGISLPYAAFCLPLDVVVHCCWGLMSLIRYQVGIRGVARSDSIALIFFGVSTIFALVSSIYLAFYQTYILRLEFIFNVFSLVLELAETILGTTAAVMYMMSRVV